MKKTNKPGEIPNEQVSALFGGSVLKVPEVEPSKPRLARTATPFPAVGIVAARYRAEGWEVLIPPARAPMDLICVRGERFQFVRTRELSDGEKNQHIQNAMSNGAEPVLAIVDGDKLSLKEVNEGRRVVIAGRK